MDMSVLSEPEGKIKNRNSLILLKFLLIILCVSEFSCSNPGKFNTLIIREGDTVVHVTIKSYSDTNSILIASSFVRNREILTSCIRINFPLFYFEIGDIDNNGREDIAIGIIKPTTYDSVFRKRPFFYRLEQGHIKKLWTGTSLSHPLENFKIVRIGPKNYLRSIEKEKNNQYLVAQYLWNGFGFQFMEYIARDISLKSAYRLF